MRAVVLREYGPPEALELAEIADPQTGPGQVIVSVAAAGINFVETMRRSGRIAPPAGERLPIVLGNEIGGAVTSLGDGVDPALLGRPVVASLGGSGGYAERVVVDATAVLPVPDALGITQATALVAQGRTAGGLARAARIAAGERVLIEAAGGGVGSLLVQMARLAGAGLVVGAARGRNKLELAQRLGADVVVDYEQPDWDSQVRDAVGPAGLDVVFDSVGGAIGRAAFGLLADGVGRFVVFGFASGAPTALSSGELFQRGLTVIGGFSGLVRMGNPGDVKALYRELVADALDKAAAGQLRPIIGQTFPLEQASEAHRALEARATVGKTLLRVGNRE